jgi:hypothetical protein
MSWIVAAVPRWLILGGLYLVLSGDMSGAEIAAALIVGGVSTALSLVLGAVAQRRFKLRVSWHRLAAEVAWSLARDAIRVHGALLATLFTRQGGRIIRQRTALPIGPQAPRAGRRAADTLVKSIAPNEYVLDFDHGTLCLHRLAGGAGADEELA